MGLGAWQAEAWNIGSFRYIETRAPPPLRLSYATPLNFVYFLMTAKSQDVTDPRLLLFDMTPLSGSAATSTLKHAYFANWRQDALLHVQALGPQALGVSDGVADARPLSADSAKTKALIDAFRPEVILYRPVDDRPMLHRFAMEAITASPAPLAMWIMDDWPERLRERAPAQHNAWDADLRKLFARSAANFAISEGMARAFSERYQTPFSVARNGVNEKDWPTRTRSPDREPVKVRYAGSLAPDTTKDSVFAAARSVSRLAAEGHHIQFEGRTQQYWFDQFGQSFNELPSVLVEPATMPMKDYRQWLVDADIVLIAYNFDNATRRYLRYSFANKTPEALAAGAAILAFGPRDLESIAILAESSAADVVTENNPDALAAALAALAGDPGRRATMGQAGRQLAFSKFDLDEMRGRLRLALSSPVRRPGALREEATREEKAQLDECRFVFETLNADKRRGVMIDVGAHHGGSLADFVCADWRVWAFEPDRTNRKILKRGWGRDKRVSISPDALGARAQKGAAFYSSGVSSGISTLTPFHESHVGGARVNVVTLNEFIAKNAITSVDFLKIDVEGHEMDVLDGLDLNRTKPLAILAEFEDAKTRARGFTAQDLIARLEGAGYTVYISEWHSIEQYGQRHSWRRLRKHPCAAAPDAWGNLIAFAKDPPIDVVERAFIAARSGGAAGVGARATIETVAPVPARSTYRKAADWFWLRFPVAARVLRIFLSPILRAAR